MALTPEPADGRWQRGEAIRAFYAADSPETCWAEWYRHSAELGVPPHLRLPRALWRLDVDLSDVADLTATATLVAHGIAALAPTRRQWPETQKIGEAYWRAGRRAILAPSAAHVGGRVLAVFRPTGSGVAGVSPIRPSRRYSELPAIPVGLRT